MKFADDADWGEGRVPKGKCRVLHLGRNNPRHQHRLEAKLLVSSSTEKDLVDNKLSLSQLCVLVAKKARGILGGTRKSPQVRGGDPAPLPSPGEAHLECCVQPWAPSSRNTSLQLALLSNRAWLQLPRKQTNWGNA